MSTAVIKINDELLEKLGVYFTYHNMYEKYGVTFEKFVSDYINKVEVNYNDKKCYKQMV